MLTSSLYCAIMMASRNLLPLCIFRLFSELDLVWSRYIQFVTIGENPENSHIEEAELMIQLLL